MVSKEAVPYLRPLIKKYLAGVSCSKADLDSRVRAGEMVYVDSYTQKDGTKIKGYYYKKPNNSFKQMSRATEHFLNNYNDMKEADTNHSDKYFYSKANCQAVQEGLYGSLLARLISDAREITDFPRNIIEKRIGLQNSINDLREDQMANYYGRNMGFSFPNDDCSELVKKYRPNGLADKY